MGGDVEAKDLSRQKDILKNGSPGEENRVLEDNPNIPAGSGDRIASKKDLTFCFREESGQYLQ